MASDKLDEKSIFNVARRIESAELRAEYLRQACGPDHELNERVTSLLDAYRQQASFLESPAAALGPVGECAAVAEHLGDAIGPYVLREQIGEGGFGAVFLAEQVQPVRRRVALKVIKPGMDTRQVVARFEAERQALAMMDHPNIAKVYDAGATASGRPYFVMELVQGVPVTEYCDQCNLTTVERLELFTTICQAVQHAHQKGVIHRDIKPTNVLVAMQDGRPMAKIIDFGVAKAIEQRLTEHTLTTAFAQMIGTPMYMSPEQAELSALGVDTRSDIYSLGVMLYELLTGATPFDKDRLHAASYDEMRRMIREEEPLRPSARLSTLASNLATTVAERRRTDARRLSQQVRGELDWIVMKCLEKDRNRRYESAGSLARDVERYLRDEPVQACPPARSYRFRKFARRNKTLLTAGGAIAAALIICLGLSTWMYFRAATESARAKTVSGLLQEMLSSANAENPKGSQYTVRELLDDFAADIGDKLSDQPAVAADIHATIGRAYATLRLPKKAHPHYEQALRLRRLADGPRHERTAAILVSHAWNLESQQRYSEAEKCLQEALAIYSERGVTGAPVLSALAALHDVYTAMFREADVARVMDEATALAEQTSGGFDWIASMLRRQANMRIKQGRFDEGEQLARQANEIYQRQPGDQRVDMAWGLTTLAFALQSQQRLEEAKATIRQSLEIFRGIYDADHPTLRNATNRLRSILEADGDQAGLDALARDEADLAAGSDSPDYHVRLAGLLLRGASVDAGSKDEARRLIRRAVAKYAEAAADAPDDRDARVKAAWGYVSAINACAGAPGFLGEVDELNRLLADELQSLLARFPDSVDCRFEAANIYQAWALYLSNYAAHLTLSERRFRDAKELFEYVASADPKRNQIWFLLATTHAFMADVLHATDRQKEADAEYRRAMEIYNEHAAEIEADPLPRITEDYARFACIMSAAGKNAAAAEFIRKAERNAQRIATPRHGSFFVVALAQLYVRDEAQYREACKQLAKTVGADADHQARVNVTVACALAPNAIVDLNAPVKHAERIVAECPFGAPYFDQFVLGAALYRAGQYDAARKNLEASVEAFPDDPPFWVGRVLYPKLFLALTRWQQNDRDDARRLLAEVQAGADAERQSAVYYWDQLALLEVLQREAEATIQEANHQAPLTPAP